MGENSEGDSPVRMLPRTYQIEMEKRVLESNSILCLPTGSGKTFVAIQIIKRLQHLVLPPYNEGGQRMFFLVNSVPLVSQQVKSLRSQLPLVVHGYSSEDKVDNWDRAQWLQQLNKVQVLVMTAQILSDMLHHNYITLPKICLLVFDECHHAVDNHPMRNIMRAFEECPADRQPKVLGLTATLINKNVKTINQVPERIKELEKTFNSKICHVSSMDEVLQHSTNPMETLLVYHESANHPCFSAVMALLDQMMLTINDVRIPKTTPTSYTTQHTKMFGSPIHSVEKIPKCISSMVLSIKRSFENFGVYGGSLAILCHIVQCERLKLAVDISTKHKLLQLAITYFNQARSITEKVLNSEPDPSKRLLAFSSSKVKQLCELLKEYSPDVIASGSALHVNKYKKNLNCLIFVRERFTCKVLYKILEHASKLLPHLSYLKVNYVVGTNVNAENDTREDLYNRKQNMMAIEKFRARQLNCIVSTEVMEEGIDLPMCNLVVMMDPISTYRSFVQAKGRARSSTSSYAMFLPRANEDKFRVAYQLYKAIENYLQDFLVGTKERKLPTSEEQAEKFQHIYPPYVHGNARVTAYSSISLLNRYCQTLPRDKFTQLQPEYLMLLKADQSRVVTVVLPVSCPVKQPIQGVPMENLEDAKRVAAVRACEALHKAKELDENLQPVDRYAEEFEEDVKKMFFSHWKSEDVTDDADEQPKCREGTKAKKRLHFRKFPSYLRGSPSNATTPRYYINSIRLTVHRDSRDENHVIVQDLLNTPQGYLLLTARQLPHIPPFTMYMSSGQVRVDIVAGQTAESFTPPEMISLRRFHMGLFLDVLDLMKGFMCYDATHGDNHYWVAPTLDGRTISWETIASYRSVEPLERPSDSERSSTSIDPEHYRHMVVAPWYRSASHVPRYIVTRVLGITPLDPFSDDSHRNYAEYFQSKYNLSLMGPESQPMLEVYYLSNKMNCLLPRSATINSGVKSRRLRMNLEQTYSSHSNEQLVPEFCVRFSFPGVLWLKATMLPSILHRLTYLLLAEELRCEINRDTGLGCQRLPPGLSWNILQSNDYVVSQSQLSETEGQSKADDDEEIEMMEVDDEQNDREDMDVDMNNTKCLNTTRDEDKYKLAVRKLMKECPWESDMEPIDLEREFDKVSVSDIECYYMFVTHKLNQMNGGVKTAKSNPGHVMAETIKNIRAICPPPFENVEKIDILSKRINQVGPQPSSILEALTTNKSNDIISLERLETLGDSFLKFGVSLYLIHKFPHFNEGQLTMLKSKIVSNRNLYHCAVAKDIQGMIKVENFNVRQSWVPPAFSLHRNVQKILVDNGISPSAVYFINLSYDEMLSGRLDESSIESIQDAVLNSDTTQEYSASTDVYIGRQEIRDKVISDCVEALIGVYLQDGGIEAALKMLSWLKILPEGDCREILHAKIETPYSQEKIDRREVDFLLDYSINRIEDILKYKFRDPCLLLEALTHASCSRNRHTGSYERLEFIGDAILDFLITCHIYERGGRLSPGELTDLRSALVNNNTFGCLVVRLKLHKFMQTSNILLDRAVNKFVDLQEAKGNIVDESVLFLLEEEDCQLAEYVEVPKALGDVFESLVGAIYLDCQGDLGEVWRVVYSIMHEEIAAFMQNVPKNPVRQMVEQVHAAPQFLATRTLPNGTIMAPLRLFVSGKKNTVHGFGRNKALAKRSAAKIGLRLLGKPS